MSPVFREIEEQAKSLPPEERARLAESLLESLQQEGVAEVDGCLGAGNSGTRCFVSPWRRRGDRRRNRPGRTATDRPMKSIRFLAQHVVSCWLGIYYNESGAGLGIKFAPAVEQALAISVQFPLSGSPAGSRRRSRSKASLSHWFIFKKAEESSLLP